MGLLPQKVIGGLLPQFIIQIMFNVSILLTFLVHIIADIIKFPTTVWIGKLVFIYISTLHYHVINVEQIIHIFREENKVLMGKTVSFWIWLKLIAVIFPLKCCCVHQMVATLFVLRIISVLFHNCNSVAATLYSILFQRCWAQNCLGIDLFKSRLCCR